MKSHFITTRQDHIRFLCFLAVSMVAVFKPGFSFADADTGITTIEDTRAYLDKWVETRRIISQEKSDWELGQEMLMERINVVKQDIETLRGKIEETNVNITEADKKRAELVKENEKFRDASDTLSSMIIGLEIHTKGLLKRFPDTYQERVKPLSQRLPDDPNNSTLSLSERFQNVIGILNETNKLNRDINVTSEVRKLPDGNSAEVTAMYVGIGQAYYVSANGEVAGTGSSSSDGWIWTPDNTSAAAIQDAVAILKNEKIAAFVQLPIKIQ